ncbi:hypothetical protein CP557_04035 [Natrinema ejinorense]|uniref:Uncharacterized protein n=1 Tax=Natrinema ejinorense TaxID=373386 RepID=A0A2A5QSJ3_9EURY|nr:hypothetical protein CP557_04035 [Natrinema ejinorense]
MTRQYAARDWVTLLGRPFEETDEYCAFTPGDARRRIPTVRPRGATAGRTTTPKRGDPRNQRYHDR